MRSYFTLNRLSIQQRLTFLICTLLLSAIVIYGFANYYSLKKTILIIGKDRLTTLTNQLGTMLGQNTVVILKAGNAAAVRNTTIQYLQSGGREFKQETLDVLGKLHRDSLWVSVELLNKNFVPVLRSVNSTRKVNIRPQEVISFTKPGPDSTRIGKLYDVQGQIYYPVVTTVTDKKEIIGYIIAWVHLKGDAKAVAQFSRLVGTGAGLYVVNSDQSLWTDLVSHVFKPPFRISAMGRVIEYKSPEGDRMMSSAEPVQNTDWIVAVVFAEQNVLNGISSFVNGIIIIGIVLTAVGVFAAWAMSRNITRPLKKLTAAASAISAGDYSASGSIDVYRSDELGELANAFNLMTAEIYHTWQNLDTKVKERTSQLERANKELEAFSYSVSHDLRTPLRAVSGYSIMLKEDYEGKLDAEGKRIIGNIITNARMMGQLIDELLAFSRLGKKALASTRIDMQMLAISVVNELLQNDLEKDYKINIGILPATEADPGMIKQVLMNLLSNAIKYSSKKAKPEIEIGSVDEETRTIYYVKDNGVGFDMAYAGKLFGVFQRLHSQDEFEGTGVGLALVKRIIDKHNGQVWAEGRENIGAAFFFSLPKK